MTYNVKLSNGKEFSAKAFSVRTLAPDHHEVIIEGYTGAGEAGSRKLISIRTGDRSGTDPERCESLTIHNEEGVECLKLSSDDSPVEAAPVAEPDPAEEHEEDHSLTS